MTTPQLPQKTLILKLDGRTHNFPLKDLGDDKFWIAEPEHIYRRKLEDVLQLFPLPPQDCSDPLQSQETMLKKRDLDSQVSTFQKTLTEPQQTNPTECLYVGYSSGIIEIFSTVTKKLLKTWTRWDNPSVDSDGTEEPIGPMVNMAISPDRKYLYTIGPDGSILGGNLEPDVHTLQEFPEGILYTEGTKLDLDDSKILTAISHDSKHLYILSPCIIDSDEFTEPPNLPGWRNYDCKFIQIDINSGTILKKHKFLSTAPAVSLLVSSDNQYLYWSNDNGELIRYNTQKHSYMTWGKIMHSSEAIYSNKEGKYLWFVERGIDAWVGGVELVRPMKVRKWCVGREEVVGSWWGDCFGGGI
jgi:hypothetical protein